MKELTIEQKAKAYDEAINIARSKIKNDKNHILYEDDIIDIFPKLKESEDVRMRNFISNELACIRATDGKGSDRYNKLTEAIAWLEKQGTSYTKKNVDDVYLKGIITKNEIEKQGEQNPTYKVKFKVGDWIIDQGAENLYQVVAHINNLYQLKYSDNYTIQKCTEVDKCVRLWSIKDAKDGDILAESKGDIILMFRGIGNAELDDVVDYYCYYDCHQKCFTVHEEAEYWGNTKNTQLKPATKEQRDLLFKKMKEAGYKWDAEKKKLKTIVVPTFNIGDTIIKRHNSDINKFGQFIITDITGGKYWYNDRIICNITEQDEWEIYEPV